MPTRTKEQLDAEIAKLQAEREALEEWPKDTCEIFTLDCDGRISRKTDIVWDWFKNAFANYNVFKTNDDAEMAKEYRLMDARYAAGLIEEWDETVAVKYQEMMTRTYGKK